LTRDRATRRAVLVLVVVTALGVLVPLTVVKKKTSKRD